MELVFKGAEYIYCNTCPLGHHQGSPKPRRRVLRSGATCPIMAF
jgi:hypothetical protein